MKTYEVKTIDGHFLRTRKIKASRWQTTQTGVLTFVNDRGDPVCMFSLHNVISWEEVVD